MRSDIDYINTMCGCGCKHIYPKLKKPIEPVKFKIESYIGNDKSLGILSIKRLSDNTIFRLGDNIQGISPLGKKGTKGIIYEFQYIEEGFMKGFLRIHCWVIGHCATFTIKNEELGSDNGDNTSNFRLLELINKK